MQLRHQVSTRHPGACGHFFMYNETFTLDHQKFGRLAAAEMLLDPMTTARVKRLVLGI